MHIAFWNVVSLVRLLPIFRRNPHIGSAHIVVLFLPVKLALLQFFLGLLFLLLR